MFLSRLPAVEKVMGSIPVGAHARSNLIMASFFEIFINNSYYVKNDNNNNDDNNNNNNNNKYWSSQYFASLVISFSVKSIIFFCALVYVSSLVYNFMFSFPQFSCRAWFAGCVRLSSTPGL